MLLTWPLSLQDGVADAVEAVDDHPVLQGGHKTENNYNDNMNVSFSKTTDLRAREPVCSKKHNLPN